MHAAHHPGNSGFAQNPTLAFLALLFVTVFSVILLMVVKGREDEDLAKGDSPYSSAEPPAIEDLPQASPPQGRNDGNQPSPGPSNPRRVLTLTVTDDTGTAPPELNVLLKTKGGQIVFQGALKAYRGDRYFLGAIPGPYLLTVSADGFSEVAKKLTSSDFSEHPVILRLTRGRRSAGVCIQIMVDKDQPLSEGLLLLRTGTGKEQKEFFVTADSNGYWARGSLPAGRYEAMVTTSEEAPRFGALRFTLEPGRTGGFSARVPMGRLAVSVEDGKTGRPLSGAQVWIFMADVEERAWNQRPGITDGRGSFVIGPVPSRRYWLVVRCPGYGMAVHALTVRSGETGSPTLRLRRAAGIPLLIQCDSGPPPDDVTLYLKWQNVSTRHHLPLLRDSAGRPCLDIAPGQYRIDLHSRGYQSVVLRLDEKHFRAPKPIPITFTPRPTRKR